MPRFLSLTIGFLVLISLMMLAEAFVIRLRWPHLMNQSSAHRVSIGDLAVSPNGAWGVSRISFDNGKLKEPQTHDIVLYNLGGQHAVRLHVGCYRPRHVAISPASDDLAIACEDGSIRIWSGLSDCKVTHSITHDRLRLFAQTSGYLSCLSFSPDGRLLAAAGSRSIHVWQWPSGELLHQRPVDEFAELYLSFSGNSQHVVSPGPRGEVCLWDAYTGRTVNAISSDGGYVFDAALSPDAEFAALFFYCQEVRVYRITSGEELWRAKRSALRGPTIAYSPDGRFLAIPGRNHGVATVVLFDAIGGQVVCELRGDETPFSRIAFGPDGLLYSNDIIRGVVRSWDIEQRRELWRFSVLEWGSNNRLFHERDVAPGVCLID